MLAHKRLILTGIVTTDSIAYAVAERMGAELMLTAFPRDRPLAEAAAAQLPEAVELLDVDITRPEDLARLTEHVHDRWGGVDGALHAIAFAPRDALSGDFLSAGAEGAKLAFETSAHSYASLARSPGRERPGDRRRARRARLRRRGRLAGLQLDGRLQGGAGVRQPLRRS